MQKRWIRWTLRVDWYTPGYLVREEIGKDKFRLEAMKRAMRFQMKLEEGGGGILARK